MLVIPATKQDSLSKSETFQCTGVDPEMFCDDLIGQSNENRANMKDISKYDLMETLSDPRRPQRVF